MCAVAKLLIHLIIKVIIGTCMETLYFSYCVVFCFNIIPQRNKVIIIDLLHQLSLFKFFPSLLFFFTIYFTLCLM